MSEHSLQSMLLRLRLSVGLLGEKAANGWWPTSFLDPGSRPFLEPVFVRTTLLSQVHGVTEAARRVHDARLAAGSFHLFRLPEEAEQDLHGFVQELARANASPSPQDPDSAMAMLEELAEGPASDGPGPKLIGDSSLLLSTDVWRKVAAVYRGAFRNGVQSYPYFSRT